MNGRLQSKFPPSSLFRVTEFVSIGETYIDVALLALWRTIKRGDSLASLCLTALQFLRLSWVSFFHFFLPSIVRHPRRKVSLSLHYCDYWKTRAVEFSFCSFFFFVHANEQSVYSILFSFRFYNKCRQLGFISFSNFIASQIWLHNSDL